MNKYNTILGQMLDLISRSHFQKQVKKYKTEHGAKGFSSWAQFVAMLYGQISNQHGLRSLEQGMNSQQNCFYHFEYSTSKCALCPLNVYLTNGSFLP